MSITPSLTIAPGRLNIKLRKGATLRKTLTYYTDSTKTTPVNLTGYTARMHVREKTSSTSTFFELTTENGGLTLGGAAGTVILFLSAADSAAATWSTAVYDIELIEPGGDVVPWLAGRFLLTEEVTK